MTSESSSSPRPRLLVLSPSVDMCGADRSLLPVTEVLAETFDITLVTPGDGPLVEQASRAGYECHVLEDWAPRRSLLRAGSVMGVARRVHSSLRFLRSLHRERPFDGIYADATADALLPFLKRAVPAPLVVHIRELPRDRPLVMKAMLRIVSRAADSVVCNSSFTAETVIANVPRLADRVRVGRNGVSAGRDRTSRHFEEQEHGRIVAGYVSAGVGRRSTIVVLSPSSDLYGSDRALLHALPALLRGNDVVIAVAANGPFVREARQAGAAVVELPDFGARRRYMKPTAAPAVLIRNLRAAWRVRMHMRRCDADLLYVNTVAVLILPLLRLVTRRPIVVHVHERARGRGWEQLLITIGVRRVADLVLTNSDFTASTLALSRDRPPVEVVHNGVEPAPLAIPDSGSPVRLVCVARLHPKKGQSVLVDAVAGLVADGHDVELDLVGDALPEHSELERQLRDQVARMGLGERVTFHGYRHDVARVYERAHVVAVPSIDPEEFSLVAAEGQMRGLAAVVTGPGGVTEVVVDGETGFVIPPDDVAELADAIRQLLTDRALMARMGASGRDRMMDRFTVDSYQSRMTDAIGTLLADD